MEINELNGVPMGKFFTDSEVMRFIGENPPSNMGCSSIRHKGMEV